MATADRSIYWHDYETFGSDPRYDRPCQFAGIRTDEDLNIIGEPLVIYCRPAEDYLPDPGACMVTGISPLEAQAKGLPEAEFIAAINKEFSRPGTCGAGYNSIRFDDEVTRHSLYRCFFDPYEREWKHGNSRWDIIDMVRLTHGVRPEGIQWPRHENGSPSFRLEDLTRANGIGHESAHDALSDVIATIEVAKLIRQRQPRLYDYLYRHRSKQAIIPMLDLRDPKPLLHVSSMYSVQQGCMAVVMPLSMHPLNQNGVLVYDLSQDPAAWLDLSAGEIRDRVFTRREDLPEGVERVGLKTIHVNKCPVLAPVNVLTEEVKTRYGIDLAQCRRHFELLLKTPGLADKMREVFSDQEKEPGVPVAGDPDLMLYSGGFFDTRDKNTMARIRTMGSEQLREFTPLFDDPRLPEMLFRYRARNYPGTLSQDERSRWRDYCRAKFMDPEPAAGLNLAAFEASLSGYKAEKLDDDKKRTLEELERYVRDLLDKLAVSR